MLVRARRVRRIMRAPFLVRYRWVFVTALCLGFIVCVTHAQTPPDEILLKNYKPRSIFKISETRVERARYPVIDVHSHDYATTDADAERWVRTMDEVGLER